MVSISLVRAASSETGLFMPITIISPDGHRSLLFLRYSRIIRFILFLRIALPAPLEMTIANLVSPSVDPALLILQYCPVHFLAS